MGSKEVVRARSPQLTSPRFEQRKDERFESSDRGNASMSRNPKNE